MQANRRSVSKSIKYSTYEFVLDQVEKVKIQEMFVTSGLSDLPKINMIIRKVTIDF